MNLPADREETIYEYSSALLDRYNICHCRSERIYMDLMEKCTDILVAKNDYEGTFDMLNKAYSFAKRKHSDYSWARYYDMLAWCYDSQLGGRYEESEEAEKLLSAIEESIRHITKKTKSFWPNSFDPDVKVQLFLFNHLTDTRKVMEKFNQ